MCLHQICMLSLKRGVRLKPGILSRCAFLWRLTKLDVAMGNNTTCSIMIWNYPHIYKYISYNYIHIIHHNSTYVQYLWYVIAICMNGHHVHLFEYLFLAVSILEQYPPKLNCWNLKQWCDFQGRISPSKSILWGFLAFHFLLKTILGLTRPFSYSSLLFQD